MLALYKLDYYYYYYYNFIIMYSVKYVCVNRKVSLVVC